MVMSFPLKSAATSSGDRAEIAASPLPERGQLCGSSMPRVTSLLCLEVVAELGVMGIAAATPKTSTFLTWHASVGIRPRAFPKGANRKSRQAGRCGLAGHPVISALVKLWK
jgi:hypothetical protein